MDDIVGELEELRDRYGMRGAMDFSDEINLLNEPLLALCQRLTPLGMVFRAFVKANLFTDRQAEAMAEAGFVEVCTGVESGSARILGVIDKQTTPEINRRFVELCHKHGMRAKAFCSLGHPGETYRTALDTRDWLLDARPDDFDLTVITVFPGTPLWAQKVEDGRDRDGHPVYRYVKRSRRPEEDGATLHFTGIDYATEEAFYKGIPKHYVSYVWTPDLSREDIVSLRDGIEDEVRGALGVAYPRRHSGDNFEHSMGAGTSPQDSRVLAPAGA